MKEDKRFTNFEQLSKKRLFRTTTNLLMGGVLKILYTHPQSYRTTLEVFQFLETVQMFSNPTPIYLRSINH